ncbi:hypothetical protein M271_27250 [Streptomyces rapamycinicus NRRL 5491]|uniref:Uncharacterized protein n=2 Tax=Streptomyces rapamycinicus TaxID=1226757 RepID=A0A0A0NLG0_STRRN|nr:hypothetical protein M271_27250 [Streptomyces rapamycinicus NRRL 5491]RLV79979.1 hypothetical protein D3C57_116380 [Streptomyces rapamycinicus NRRL 5491]
MAFSADELRVLRRALAIALQPDPVTPSAGPLGPDRAEEVQDCLRLAEAVDEAVREGGRLRAFLLDELARYRAALPGATVGYLEQLQGALAAGYEPLAEDLAALRALCGSAAGGGEATRRRALLSHCERLAERGVRTRLAERAGAVSAVVEPRTRPVAPRLRALPGGVSAASGTAAQGAAGKGPEAAREAVRKGPEAAREAVRQSDEQKREPRKKPTPPEHGDREEPKRREPGRRAPRPGRPVPTPAEVFPPKRRRPSPPPEHESRLAPGAGARSA